MLLHFLRDSLRPVVLGLLCCGFPLWTASTLGADSGTKGSRPNIIVILCDDLGYECLNCYGGTSYKTPNLDALAASGMRFQNCYATPLCSPSRVQLMTGRYGFRTGWINLIGRGGEEAKDYFDPTKERTFGHMLKEAGYATALAGKWQLAEFLEHPNHVRECGFDEYCCWAWELGGKRTSRYGQPVIWQDGKVRKNTESLYGEDVFSDFLIDFMKRNKDKPFFVYYPMVLVHEPHTPTPDSHEATESAKADKEKSDGKAQAKQQRTKKWFPDMMAYMDKSVGRLVGAVDKLGLRENTIILFTGDNGTDHNVVSKLGAISVRGGKGTTTEFGTHVPLIASWKGRIASGQVTKALVDFSDVLPTLAELSSSAPPSGVKIDGRSFVPTLLGKQAPARSWVFSQLGHQRLVRDERYMLHEDGRLYEIDKDPFEAKDLGASAEPEILEAKKKLGQVLDRLK